MSGARQRRGENGITPHWGPSKLTRRVYDPDGDCLGEQALGTPSGRMVLAR